MTIIAAEAAPGAVAKAETAVASRGAAASAPARRPRARRATGSAAARNRAASERDRARRKVGPYADRPEPNRKSSGGQARGFAEGYAADAAHKARNHGKRSLSFTAGKGDYHKIVAAEFLFAVAVITVAPLVTPGSGSASTGPSPYGRQDIQRLAGVFTLFFILALVSHGRPGKMAVMFGGLVDLGVLFRASQRGVLKGVGQAFSKGGGTTASGGGGQQAGGSVA